MSGRDNILKRLRAVQHVDVHPPPFDERLDVVPHTDEDLLERFVAEAEKLKATVRITETPDEAVAAIAQIIGDEKRMMGWDMDQIPVAGLANLLERHGIEYVAADSTCKIGITGADAAIAATGSLVLCSGAGKSRNASLTAYTHIAVIRQTQLVFNFEAWMRHQQVSDLRQVANIVVISGASRTADIAMELVLGAHGPAELFVIVVP